MKLKKLKQLICAGILSSTILLSGTTEAGIVADGFPLTCYVDHHVNTFDGINGRQVGYIDANVDWIKVYEFRDGWVRASYNGLRSGYTRWFRVEEICADPNYSNRPAKVQGNQNVFTTRNSNTKMGSVSNNEDVIVLAESNGRVQIRYRLDNGSGYKMGWIPSSAVSYINENPNPSLNSPEESNVIKKIESYINGSQGNYWRVNTKWTGGNECRGFAQQLYSKLFQGAGSITGYANNNYSASNFPGSYESGRLFDFGANDVNAVKNLFQKAKPGAFIQMGRRHSLNRSKTAPGPHTSILHKVESDGVWFYEANAGGTGMITYKKYSWSDLADKNRGFTIYLPNNYALR